MNNNIGLVQRHIKTHSERSDDDRAAISVLETFLRSDGKINTNFASNDTWPNTDGTFEYVSNPDLSRSPKQSFFVQVKGTINYAENEGIVKYSLKSLAFPAFVYCEVTLDPSILFVVLNSKERGKERVFWKYISTEFLNSIDFSKDSSTISFTSEEEIKNTDESISEFCNKLSKISDHHSFINKLDSREYSKQEAIKLIESCNEDITERINRLDIYNDTRDNVSKKILNRMYDICIGALLLNTIGKENQKVNIQLAWEKSLLNINTKYLGTFLKGLKYIGSRIPQEGQSERLMLKYYEFLWQIRSFLEKKYGIKVIENLEKFPRNTDKTDEGFYNLVALAIQSKPLSKNNFRDSRYYIQKKTPFFNGKERYYELTLQLAGIYATKYNRITVYTKEEISTSYSIRIAYEERNINLWDVDTKIKVVTSWMVSIDPWCLNKLSKILNIPVNLKSQHGEYVSLMRFLTDTGMNLLEMIDLNEKLFSDLINKIYEKTNTHQFKEVLLYLQNNFPKTSKKEGKNVLRFILHDLREDVFIKILPNQFTQKLLCNGLGISSKCYPFEKRPFLSNLAGSKTSNDVSVSKIVEIAGDEEFKKMSPYLEIRNLTKNTGEIYFEENSLNESEYISEFNAQLDNWERQQGYEIKSENGLAYISAYEKSTLLILNYLIKISKTGNAGQEAYNKNFIEKNNLIFQDVLKELAIKFAFVNSNVLIIYGAAGTGKTLLLNYLSNLLGNKKKLFLTKTHTARRNLERRIDNPGLTNEFVSIDSFTRKVNLADYDAIFIDECSTIDNRVLLEFLNKINENTFLILAGDIYQIESIDFGNWFYYAKDIVSNKGSNIELLNTWRTEDPKLISLWEEVRNKNSLIVEKLALDGPFSEDISKKIFLNKYEDEVVLCLNYDGKFGLNNINAYFQNANNKGELVYWKDWTYKVGDKIIFNDSERFSQLYNNLKGTIINIEKDGDKISFTIDVDTIITEKDCHNDGIKYIDTIGGKTRINFDVFDFIEDDEDDERISKSMCIVPFQLAYAVSIHKAQGLEYDSVKIIIPSANAEKISHSIFYTAITRAKKSLKIFWSPETMKEIVKSFSLDDSHNMSLKIIKSKLNI